MKFRYALAEAKRTKISNDGHNLPEWVKSIALATLLTIYVSGCGNKFWDPTQVGRFRPTPAVNVILDTLGVAEETPSAFAGAEDPRPSDVVAYESDYVFGPGDVVRISIFELLQVGAAYQNDYVVTETGKISIPEVGVVDAAGMTESQLEDEIRQILSPSILKNPSVTVTLMTSERRTFTISGEGVPRPSRYTIPRYDFRLLDALATAGGIAQFNISYVYVSRRVTGKEPMTGQITPAAAKPESFEQKEMKSQDIKPEQKKEQPKGLDREMMEIIAPSAHKQISPEHRMIITSSEMATKKELTEAALPEGFDPGTEKQPEGDVAIRNVEKAAQTASEDIRKEKAVDGNDETGKIEATNRSDEGRIEWIFQNGKWVPVQIGGPKTEIKAPEKELKKEVEKPQEKAAEQSGWEQIGTGGVQTRVIKVPADKLAGGDPRYNIVIKPGDSIQVPVDIIGEFCIMGNVNSQGFVNLTGRPMTLKMAIASAGGLGPLAIPKRCEIVRRVSKDKEEIVMVDLDKIAGGEQPDFFIKPNDLINVGTDSAARWRAVLRNAFRATYGFGFIYDRNFADPSFKKPLTFTNIEN